MEQQISRSGGGDDADDADDADDCPVFNESK